MKKHIWLIGSIVALVLLLAGAALAQTTTDFEGFATGQSVNGQDGWTVEDEWGNSVTDFDEVVTIDSTDNTVWRASNAVTSGGYGGQPYSPTSQKIAGESDAGLWNDRGDDHTNPLDLPNENGTAETDLFHAGLRFKSATDSGQADLFVSLSPAAKQSAWRMSYVSISDDGSGGFDLGFFDTGPGSDFNGTTLVTGLSYSDWHTLDIFIDFNDGINEDGTGNDVVYVVVDGTLVHTGTTWETYYRTLSGQGFHDFAATQAVDALLFRFAGVDDAVPANAGNGFYFDDVVIDNAARAIAVDIDIKPGSDPNSINLDSNGVIPVAILTTDDFDASTVDPSTVRLSGAEVRVKGKSGNEGSLEDIDGDGDLDLVVQVYNDMDLVEGETEAQLTAETYDGVPIAGSDSIRIVPE